MDVEEMNRMIIEGIRNSLSDGADAALADKLLRSGSNQYQAGEIENAVENYRKAAHLGNAAAMYEYGLFLCDGEGCEKNELYGSFWYWEAAQAGEVRAMYNLGVNYREGVGVKKDMVQMLYWYARLAEQLCEEAVYSLGASLAGGEVLFGENTALVGHTFMRAATQINGSRRAQEFVKENVKIILDILAEGGGLYNLPPDEKRC